MNFYVPSKRTILGCIALKNLSKTNQTKFSLAMKMTIFLIVVFTIQSSANVFSQRLSLSVKDAGLGQVIKEIRKQTGFLFLYEKEFLKNAKPITLSLNNTVLDEALDKLFDNQPFTYQ